MTQRNKIGVYIMRQNYFFKKIIQLQACFLRDVGVIWCNSLGNSHFQICVINNVEIVLEYYLQITSHVSHAFTSCTHFTSYSLLSFVHGIVCESSLAIQDYVFYGVWCKICLRVGRNCLWWLQILFLKFWVENKCFWKTFKLILMYFIHEIIWVECFLHKLVQFFKKFRFPEFRLIECVSWPIEIPLIFNHDFLLGSIDIRSMLEQSKLGNFQFLSFWPNFFYSSFVFKIHMHCIVFYIHLAVLQVYLSSFSHITCIHFAKLSTQLDLKINWLIFELCTF